MPSRCRPSRPRGRFVFRARLGSRVRALGADLSYAARGWALPRWADGRLLSRIAIPCAIPCGQGMPWWVEAAGVDCRWDTRWLSGTVLASVGMRSSHSFGIFAYRVCWSGLCLCGGRALFVFRAVIMDRQTPIRFFRPWRACSVWLWSPPALWHHGDHAMPQGSRLPCPGLAAQPSMPGSWRPCTVVRCWSLLRLVFRLRLPRLSALRCVPLGTCGP